MVEARELKKAFSSLFGAEARIYRAPGRVNLIGEHTDYNDGFVMPAAIDLYTWVAVAPREDRMIRIHSENFSETAEFSLEDRQPNGQGHWSDYPRGVAVVLDQMGHRLKGADLLIRGELPIGAGLSSSAAVEVATAFALIGTGDAIVDRVEIAKLCQLAENDFVGMHCGLMDQFVSCFGQAGRALMLDCRSLDYEMLGLPRDARLVVSNTLVKHELAASEYNARRAECEEGVEVLARSLPHVRALRDVTRQDLESLRSALAPSIYRRCVHVISENARVLDARTALEREDLDAFGRLMRESHKSLRDNYAVSCPELDLIVELASTADGVYGARMTGGGFGGSAVSIVRAEYVAAFKQKVANGYEDVTGLKPDIYVSSPAQGAQEIVDI